MPHDSKIRRIVVGSLLACVLPCGLAGCNIVAPVVMIVEGPPKYEPQFKLSKDRPTLILVDDQVNVLPRPSLRITMSKQAQTDLLKKGTLTKVIDCGSAYAVIARDREGTVTSLVDVAKTVEAEVIISVTIDSWGRSQGNEMQAECAFRVRVLDATKDKEPRIWPPVTMPEGARFKAIYKMPAGTEINTESQARIIQEELGKQTGRAIGQIFYEHEKKSSALAF
jgi:hypothetical protein